MLSVSDKLEELKTTVDKVWDAFAFVSRTDEHCDGCKFSGYSVCETEGCIVLCSIERVAEILQQTLEYKPEEKE